MGPRSLPELVVDLVQNRGWSKEKVAKAFGLSLRQVHLFLEAGPEQPPKPQEVVEVTPVETEPGGTEGWLEDVDEYIRDMRKAILACYRRGWTLG